MRIDWDAYRARYDRMTYADVATFHRQVWRLFPDQEHHSPEHLARFFASLDEPRRVIEVGGWRGSAAGRTLAAYPAIERWDNYEICQGAVNAPVTKDPRYHAVWPDRWPWEVTLSLRHDTGVLAHVIEHMRARQLELLVRWLASNGVRDLYVEAPLRETGRSWRHSSSAHLLEIGAADVLALFERWRFGLRERDAYPPDRQVFYLRGAA